MLAPYAGAATSSRNRGCALHPRSWSGRGSSSRSGHWMTRTTGLSSTARPWESCPYRVPRPLEERGKKQKVAAARRQPRGTRWRRETPYPHAKPTLRVHDNIMGSRSSAASIVVCAVLRMGGLDRPEFSGLRRPPPIKRRLTTPRD
jgi:hypothetical protein